MHTIPDLIADAARRFGAQPALGIRRGLRTELWSYHDVERGMHTAAEGLKVRGVQPGDCVLVLAPNSPELVLSMLGIWAAGAILVPLDLRTPTDVMTRIAERTSPRLLVTDLGDVLPGVATARPGKIARTPHPLPPGVPSPPPPLPAAGEGRPTQTIGNSSVDEVASDPSTPPLPLRERGAGGEGSPGAGGEGSAGGEGLEGLAEIVFTSGTTGAPKGVMLTHRNILASVSSAQEAVPIAAGTALLSLLPLSHMMEQAAGLLAPLASGGTVYYATSRRSSAIVSAFQRHGIGLMVCVPEILSLLMAGIEREVDRSGSRKAWDALNALAERLPMRVRPTLFRSVHAKLGGQFRMALCGGAAVPPAAQAAWERLGVRVVQGYGATECAPVIASNRPDRRVPGTVGWAVPRVDVRLAADGEVLVRGPNVTPGYYHDPAATAASFEDGWYKTGDLGEFLGGGALRLRGRKKEMIVLADGRNVFPEDVEPVLRADPAVKECAVVGKPRGTGVEVHAVVIPAEAGTDTGRAAAEAAVRRANGQLGPHQQIGGWSLWPDAEFPRTPSLKIKRAEVLAALVEERSAAAGSAPVSQVGEGGSLESKVAMLLARATGRPLERVQPDADLHLDLGLDSLGRVELAVLLEEELGRTLSDEQVAELRTVRDLLAALEQPGSATAPAALPGWPRSWPVRALRAALQDAILFPLLRRQERPLTVVGRERLAKLRGPALLIANHASHLDALTILATLPPARRRKTAVAAAADYFFTDARLAFFASLVLGAFPFHRTGPVAASLAHCGDLADAGYSLLVFPEGTRSPSGKIAPFKPGIGLLARELGVPVVPIYLDGLHAILPKGRTLPKPGPARVIVGEPLTVDPRLSNAQAAATLEAALRALAPQ